MNIADFAVSSFVLIGPLITVGASLTAFTVTVLVTALLRLFAPEPSLTCQVMVRADVEGLSLVFW